MGLFRGLGTNSSTFLPYDRGALSSASGGGFGGFEEAAPMVGGLAGLEGFGVAGFSANRRYDELKVRHWQKRQAAA